MQSHRVKSLWLFHPKKEYDAPLYYLRDWFILRTSSVFISGMWGGGPLSPPASSGNLADAPVQPIARKEHTTTFDHRLKHSVSPVWPSLPYSSNQPKSTILQLTNVILKPTIVILQPSNIILKQTNIVRQRENGELMHFTNLKTMWSNEMTSFFYAL